MAQTALNIVILAAGKGTRMYSKMPKVLHRIGGKPMVERVIDTAAALNPQNICVVIGHGKEQVLDTVKRDVVWVEQTEQLGTGHAVKTALPHLSAEGRTLVLYGDVPLIDAATLETLLEAAGDEVGLLTDVPNDPTGLGRIIRDSNGSVTAIVEEKDADAAQKAVKEINTGILVLPNAKLEAWLNSLSSNNAQGEYYLTDLIAKAVADYGYRLSQTGGYVKFNNEQLELMNQKFRGVKIGMEATLQIGRMKDYTQQIYLANSAMQRLSDATAQGALTQGVLNDAASAAARAADKLGNTELTKFRNAIADAQRRLNALRQEASDATRALEAELPDPTAPTGSDSAVDRARRTVMSNGCVSYKDRALSLGQTMRGIEVTLIEYPTRLDLYDPDGRRFVSLPWPQPTQRQQGNRSTIDTKKPPYRLIPLPPRRPRTSHRS